MTWPYFVVVMAGVVLISGCASVGSGSDAPSIQEATQRADERAATLNELVPEQTGVLIQLQYDRWEDATRRLELDDVPGLGRVDDALERLDAFDAVDTTRPLVAAVATTGNEDFVEHSWAHGWVTDREELAGGLHVRVIIPSHDASSLVEHLASLCEEDEAAPCRAKAHGQGFASVDVVVEAAGGEGEELLSNLEGDGASGVPWLERRTPALQAFLNADAPVAVYWSGHRLLDVMTVYRSAVLRSVLETVGDAMSPSHMAHALLQSHGSHLSKLMTDPDSREFEDFAVIADATESDGAGELQFDLVRTFTREGHELWHGDDEGFDDVMARAKTPTWVDDPVDGIDRWVVGLEMYHHKGEIIIRFFIMPGGDVDRVELVESTIDDEELTTCIKEQVGRWRFADLFSARTMRFR